MPDCPEEMELPLSVRERLAKVELRDAKGRLIASAMAVDWSAPLERQRAFVRRNFERIAECVNGYRLLPD